MNRVVADASVVVKWIFPDDPRERDAEYALALLDAIRDGRTEVLQPPHWLAEVAAVVIRLQPDIAGDVVSLLDAMELSVVDSSEVYVRACELGAELDHHVFDTLYHAVALGTPEATLVTADPGYYRKARHLGAITTLRDAVVA